MGFDIYGVSARSPEGEYFRNNVWWWRPLWDYIATNCSDILMAEDIENGSFNDHWIINEDKARKIADKLDFLVTTGEAAKYEAEYSRHIKELPLVKCDCCHGTGTRDDQYVKGKCNMCDGKGEAKEWKAHYPFSVENVKDFIKFCRDSGGFAIC